MIVDLSDPTRALTPTLDGPVLSVLAKAGHPLTVGEIAQQAARGSEIGIRRSVARLVEQGLVTATQMGRNLVHELNRDHVAAPAAALLADLRLELWKRLRDTLSGWAEKPVHAAVFGSAARADGGVARLKNPLAGRADTRRVGRHIRHPGVGHVPRSTGGSGDRHLCLLLLSGPRHKGLARFR